MWARLAGSVVGCAPHLELVCRARASYGLPRAFREIAVAPDGQRVRDENVTDISGDRQSEKTVSNRGENQRTTNRLNRETDRPRVGVGPRVVKWSMGATTAIVISSQSVQWALA